MFEVVVPTLLFPIHVYTVVWGKLVGTCKSCSTTELAGWLPLYHWTVGFGNPVALQYSESVSPTFTLCGDLGGTILTTGASAQYNSLHIIIYLKTAIQALKKGAAKSGSPTEDGHVKKVVKSRWRPRHGCDGQSTAKFLNNNNSGEFCADS